MTAMDLTRDTIQSHLARLRPDFVLFDFSHWLPGLARELGIKSMYFISAYMVSVAYFNPLATVDSQHHDSGSRSPLDPPPSFPSSVIRLRAPEIRLLTGVRTMVDADGGLTFPERIRICFRECDAIGVNTCKEMEGHYCDCLRKQAGKPVALAGPVVPRPEPSRLDDYIDCWLKSFSRGSVVYCALGSEYAMEKDQFLELVLGLELTGKPFLAALKPPKDYDTVESALPEGFTERTKGRGIIHGGWVQQQLILHHGSVGCFVTHCGSGSLAEALVSKCQIVMMPQVVDQFFHARMMSLELKVGVEVKRRDEDGLFTREAIDEAVAKMMDEESEVGREMRINHTKWRDLLLSEGLEESYMSTFIQSLQDMLG